MRSPALLALMKFAFIISWAATFLQLMLRLSWGVLAVALSFALHLNSVEIGAVLSFFYLGYVVSSMSWGAFIDYFGPKRAIFLSTLLLGLALIPVLFLTNVYELYAVYLLEGLFTAGIFPSAVKVVSSLGERVTAYVSFLESAVPFALLASAVASPLILKSWKWFYVTVIVAALVTSALSLRLRVSHKPSRGITKIVLNRGMIKAALIRAGELWGTWGTSSWLFPFLVLYDGIGRFDAELLFFLYALGQFVSIALASKSRNERHAIRASLSVFIASAVAVAFVRNVYALMVVAPLLGVSSFLYRPTTDSLIVKMMGNENAGRSMGFANVVSQVGSLLAPLFVGAMIRVGLSSLAIVGLALGPLLSLVLIMTI